MADDDAAGAGAEPDGEEDRDWFGYPVERPRAPVRCPRCERTFTDRAAYTEHVTKDHGLTAKRVHGGTRREQVALGQNPRGTWSRRLRTMPLVIVVALNVALVLGVLGTMAALGPAWWDDLMAEEWSLVVLIPLLWPTVLFLAVRGID